MSYAILAGVTQSGLALLTVLIFVWVLFKSLQPIRELLSRSNAFVKTGIHPTVKGQHGETMREAFEKSIASCQGFIKIVAGECSTRAYSLSIGEAMRKRIGEGIGIQIICGPILAVRDSDGSSPILELAREKKIDLYLCKRRIRGHFRVADCGLVYYEAPHGLGDDRRYYRFASDNPFESQPFIEWFNYMLKHGKAPRSFDPAHDFTDVAYPERFYRQMELGTTEIVKSDDPDMDFLLVKEKDISKLRKRIENAGKSVDDLTREEIELFLNDITEEDGSDRVVG